MPNFFINVKEKGAKAAGKNIGSLTKSMKMMALQAVSVVAVMQGLKKSIQMSAEMEGVRRGFDNLAKSQGFSTTAFTKFKEATDGTIDSLTLLKKANTAMLLGITDSEDQMADMFDIAQRLGQSLGIDTVQAIDSLVTGMGRQCLTSDSFISTKNGMKQIIDIKEGDIVLSNNNGKIIETEVTHLHNNGIQPIYIITFKDGKYIKSTDNHRYLTDHGWKCLSELDNGSKILNIDNEYSEIYSIDSFGEEEVYDLTVPETANFFANGLNVHNSKLMLDNLGIMVDTNQSYKEYANVIGKSVSELTDQERKTAFVNAAMEEANFLVSQLGEEQLTTKDAMAQVSNAASQVAVSVGDLLAPTVIKAAELFVGASEAISQYLTSLKTLNVEHVLFVGDHEKVGVALDQTKNRLAEIASITHGSANMTARYKDEVAELEAHLESLNIKFNETNMLFVEGGLPPLEMIQKAQRLIGSNWTELQVNHNAFTTDYLANIKKVEASEMTIAKAVKISSDERKKARLEHLQGIISNTSTVQGEIRKQIKARFASMIAGLLEKEIGTKGIFGLALAPILAATASQLFDSLIPKFAQGADFITNGPQMMMVGDNPGGGREHVQVTPLSSPNENGPQGGGGITVNVSGNLMSSDYVEGELAEQVKEAIRKGSDFGIS